MLLDILGLPKDVKYSEIKDIIKYDCKIESFLLDNMVLDDDKRHKKIRIGVADESEGEILMQRLNGCRISGQVITVVPIGKTTQPQMKPHSDYGNAPHVATQGQYMGQLGTPHWQATSQWSGPNEAPYRAAQSLANQSFLGQGPSQYDEFSSDKNYRDQSSHSTQSWKQPQPNQSLKQFPFNSSRGQFADRANVFREPDVYINEPMGLLDLPSGRHDKPTGRRDSINRGIEPPIRRRDESIGRSEPMKHPNNEDLISDFSRQYEKVDMAFAPKHGEVTDTSRDFRIDGPFPKHHMAKFNENRAVRNEFRGNDVRKEDRRWDLGREGKGDNIQGNIRREVSFSRVSPDRQSFSRRPSPMKRDLPGRFSPRSYDEGQMAAPNMKQLRSVYEPISTPQESNQAIYSVGYQSKLAQDVEYPTPGVHFEARDLQERNISYPTKNQVDEISSRNSRSPLRHAGTMVNPGPSKATTSSDKAVTLEDQLDPSWEMVSQKKQPKKRKRLSGYARKKRAQAKKASESARKDAAGSSKVEKSADGDLAAPVTKAGSGLRGAGEGKIATAKRVHLDVSMSLVEEVPKRPKLDTSYRGPAQIDLLVAITGVDTAYLSTSDSDFIIDRIHREFHSLVLGEAEILAPEHVPQEPPEFRGKPIRGQGYVGLWCKTVNTYNWLCQLMGRTVLPSGERLQVGKHRDLPRRIRCGVAIPGKWEDSSRVGKILAYQNKWAEVRKWRVHKNDVQDNTTFMIFSVPESVIPAIVARGRRLSFLTGTVYVLFRHSNGRFQKDPPISDPVPSKDSSNSPVAEEVRPPTAQTGTSMEVSSDFPGQRAMKLSEEYTEEENAISGSASLIDDILLE